MYALIRCAAGESDCASVSPSQIGHISWPSSSGSVGCCSLAAAGAASTSASEREDERASRLQRPLDAVPDVGGLHLARHVHDDLAGPVDEERLGQPVSPYFGEVTLWLSCTSG